MTAINRNIPGRKLAAITAILSLPFAYLTQALFMSVLGGDVSIFYDGEHMMAL